MSTSKITCRVSGEQAPRQEDSRGKQPPEAGTQRKVLDLLQKETPKPDYGDPVPARISGRVVLLATEAAPGAEGVSVTDGFSVVKTDARGACTLRPDPRAVFVYITRPSGYDVQGDWYKPLAAEVDFALKPAAHDENEYVFAHVEWMKQDMARRRPGAFVVTTAESDLTKHCPGFLEMAKQQDVRFQLLGDQHIVSHKVRPVPYRTAGALSGCWWNPKAKQLCPDLSPQGYLIYRVTGEKLDDFYKGLGRRVEIVSHRLGAAWRGRVEVQAHLVQPRPHETLEYTVNGNDWQAMREIGRPFYRILYSATVDSTSLSDGLLKFAVRSTTSGEVRSREFVVVNGQTSSLFEADATLAFSVSPATGWTTPRAPAGKVDALFNGKVVGVLEPAARREYSFAVPASVLKDANTLSFRFAQPGDGLSLSSPLLTFRGKVFRDRRDEAIRQVKIAHWGNEAADWGGFIAGDAEPPDETPFHRKQNVFCFLLRRVE